MSEGKVGREYGFTTVEKQSGKWKAIIGYREYMADGSSKRGRVTKTLDIASSEKNNRGHDKAQKLAEALKKELAADEPRRLREIELEQEGELAKNPTASEFMAYYLNTLLPAKKHIEPSTMNGYRRYEGMLAKSSLGSMKLARLSAVSVGGWRDELTRKHYAPVTTRCALRLLRSALNEAVKLHLINENPAADVKPPSNKKTSSEVNYLEASERERLLVDLNQTLHGEMAHDEKRAPEQAHMALGIKIALLTGMREGEICALRWSNVDIEGKSIHVREAIGRTETGFYIKQPKSGSSVRDIPINDELAADLKARKEQMQAQADAGHIKWSEQIFVLGEVKSIDGSSEWWYRKPIYLWRSWSRRVERLALKGKTGEPLKFHDLRHTFATVAATSGIPAAILQTIMGHSDISVTNKYYIGIDDSANRQAMQNILAAM